jgi:hypothetical protein
MEPESLLPCSLAPNLSQMNPVENNPDYLSKIHFNIINLPTSSPC